MEPPRPREPLPPQDRPVAADVADLAVGAASVVVGAAHTIAVRLARHARPVARVLARPPGLPAHRSPGRLLEALADRGRARRVAMTTDAERLVRALVPVVVDAVLDELDLTAIVRRRVDLDAIAAALDVDAVVARADVDAVVARADVDAVVARADIDRVVERVDVDAIADRLDLDRVIARVDLDAIAARLDLDAIIARLDLIGLAGYVVDGIDLPGIIRESSGTMASEAVHGVRMQSIEADEAVSRVVDRLLRRHRTPDHRTPDHPAHDQPALDHPADDHRADTAR